MANDGEDRRSDLAVMEANEYKQKHRLRQILDAHDAVEERAAAAYEMFTIGEIDERGKNIVLLRAVQQFVREIWNLLIEHDEELPEDTHSYYLDGNLNEPLGYIEFSGRDPVVFVGLHDVLTAKDVYSDTWTETVEARHGPAVTRRHEETKTVPERVSWAAFLRAKRFVAEEHDLEIRFEELDDSLPSWGYFEVEDDGEPPAGRREEEAHGDD